jgi:hypothetical protein
MSRALINLCQPSKTEDLDPLELSFNDTDQAIARRIRASLAQQMEEKEVEGGILSVIYVELHNSLDAKSA